MAALSSSRRHFDDPDVVLRCESPRIGEARSALPLALTGWLPAWDLERRRADLSEVVVWTAARLRTWGCAAESLSSIALDGERAHALAQRLTRASLSPDLRRPLHRAMRAMIPELPWERVWVQTFAHFRILVPGDEIAPVPAHTDYGFGHALDERNVWLALTDATGVAALHAWDLSRSLSWLLQGHPKGALVDARPLPSLPVRQGDALLFTPLHLHGARMPDAAARVSIDVRIVPRPRGRADYSFSPLWTGS